MMVDLPISRQKPSRLVTMGVGLSSSKSVNVGRSHQVDELPPFSDDIALPPRVLCRHVQRADLEKEVAVASAKRLTAAAFEKPAAAAEDAAAAGDGDEELVSEDEGEDEDEEPAPSVDVDEKVMQDLMVAGTFVGGGRSSYDPERHGALGVGKKKVGGMLAFEMEALRAKPKAPLPPAVPSKREREEAARERKEAAAAEVAAAEAARLEKLERQRKREERERERRQQEEAAEELRLQKMLRELSRYIVECGGQPTLVAGFKFATELCDDEATGKQVSVTVWCSPEGLMFRSRIDVARHYELIKPKRGGERRRNKEYL